MFALYICLRQTGAALFFHHFQKEVQNWWEAMPFKDFKKGLTEYDIYSYGPQCGRKISIKI